MVPQFPVFDLHGDLLSYLINKEGSTPMDSDIGCSIPFWKKGNVKLQVLSIFTTTNLGSVKKARHQAEKYKEILNVYSDHIYPMDSRNDLNSIIKTPGTAVMVAIENASGICEEEDHLDQAFFNLEQIIEQTGPLFYITITHHTENRFGGGNYSKVGLKPDGEILLEYLSGKKIAVDLSHTSDKMAFDLLNFIDQKQLDIPVIASHSNFRNIWDHPRNLPEELVREIIKRKGLMGMNFVRAFVDNDHHYTLQNHIRFGWANGLEDHLAFGADFFWTGSLNDPQRIPYFHPEHENAGKYPSIIDHLKVGEEEMEKLEKLCYLNVCKFIKSQIF
ncbi:dipeptidase [Flexithrix dorotheae]|uniref:dipeptidase n=1 Tax=Flexithrix dorotheae TaxID=70993 RepID=UPI00035C1C93|nr:membrane dipeptidase [Flexithrix dorotheae]